MQNTTESEAILGAIDRNLATVSALKEQVAAIGQARQLVVDCLKRGGKVLTAGNGGSAAEAMHMSEELIGRYKTDRPALAAVSLVADPTALSCICNDYGYEALFSRQVEGLGRPGGVLVLFSTSGNSANIVHAHEAAKALGVTTLCVLGRDGGKLQGLGDCEIIVPGNDTERIQEAHQVVLHVILDAVEKAFTP